MNYSEGEGEADSSFKTAIFSDLMPEAVRQQNIELFRKFHPIELSQTISKDVKLAAMKEWWDEDFRLFVEAGYAEGDFAKMCLDSKLLFRKGML